MSRPTIAVIGASADRRKFGNKAVRAYLAKGWEVFPIHPRHQRVEGIAAFASIRDIPRESLDRVSFYVPPHVGLRVLPELASKLIGDVWLNPGSESPELVAACRALGLNIVQGCSIVAIGAMPE